MAFITPKFRFTPRTKIYVHTKMIKYQNYVTVKPIGTDQYIPLYVYNLKLCDTSWYKNYSLNTICLNLNKTIIRYSKIKSTQIEILGVNFTILSNTGRS